jgi:hypothetical protein
MYQVVVFSQMKIKILPEKALELLIAGIPPADILDAFEDVPEPV